MKNESSVPATVFALAMKDSWELVDPLRPSGQPGSYARGHYQGIIDGLRTVQANFDRYGAQALQAVPKASLWPSTAAHGGAGAAEYQDAADLKTGQQRLLDIASGGDRLVTGAELETRLGALDAFGWFDVKTNPPLDRIRVILASDDYIYGDCFFGPGSVNPELAGNPDYAAERAESVWRYSLDESAVHSRIPDFSPTNWQPLPPALKWSVANYKPVVGRRSMGLAADKAYLEVASTRLAPFASGGDQPVIGAEMEQRLDELSPSSPSCGELVQWFRQAANARPTAVNGYKLNIWAELEEKIAEAVTARAMELNKDPVWRNIDGDPPVERMRVILASDDFVFGDCFFGRGSVRAGMASNQDYVAERAQSSWRYSSNEDALPAHMKPTKWQVLPAAPGKAIPMGIESRAPRKMKP